MTPTNPLPPVMLEFHSKFSIIWYDMWIGFYYDRVHCKLYFCPLPCCVFVFWIELVEEHENETK